MGKRFLGDILFMGLTKRLDSITFLPQMTLAQYTDIEPHLKSLCRNAAENYHLGQSCDLNFLHLTLVRILLLFPLEVLILYPRLRGEEKRAREETT